MMHHLSIPQYLLESSFCLLVFYLFYHILLKKETFFQFNRFFLIITAFLALCIPVINIDFNSASQISGAEQILPLLHQVNDIQIGIQQSISQESNILHVSLADVINWVYIAGLLIMSLKLFSGLFKLFGIINRSPKLRDKDHTLLISEDVPAASFFSYIFWKDKHDKSDPIQNTILDHEMVHVRQWHSLDVVTMELMVIIKWFNPLIYLFRNSLKKTHEFIADRYVTNQMGDKMQYASILLKNSGPTDIPPISNHFYGNIKERIKMLGAKQSTKLHRLKYFAVIPITLMLFALFSFDLSDRLPQPIKNSFNNLETTVLSAMETNVVSLDTDKEGEEKEENVYFLEWNNIMKIKLTQKFEIQDFLFYYSKTNLEKLLATNPNISHEGQRLEVIIDTIEVVTETGRKHISLESLKDEEYRNYLIDSLGKHDQITLGLKTFSNIDSLFIKLHLGVDDSPRWYSWYYEMEMDKTLKWGQRKIEFNDRISREGRRLNLDHSVTDEELTDMLDNKLEFSSDSRNYKNLPENMEISFTVRRANNTKLASLDSKSLDHYLKDTPSEKNVVSLVSYYHGKNYTIQEESKSFTLKEFYLSKETFKQWVSSCQNGDNISVKIDDPNDEYGDFEFNLRYRDDSEAITAPFPIELPHSTDAYSNFQIVFKAEGKSLVRMDTKAAGNKKIVDTYSGSDSYEIIHIDDFKTKNRVKKTSLPEGELTNEILDNPEIGNLDMFTLNDYYTDDDELIRIDWGRLVSMPNIGNYSIKEFKRSSKFAMNLFVGTKDLKMARFDLLIIPENGTIERIRTNNVLKQGIREKLSNVSANTSIYVDNIIVDVNGELMNYPYNFVFTVE